MSIKFSTVPQSKWDKLYGASAYFLWISIWLLYRAITYIDTQAIYSSPVTFYTNIDWGLIAWFLCAILLPIGGVFRAYKAFKLGNPMSCLIWLIFSGCIIYSFFFIPSVIWSFNFIEFLDWKSQLHVVFREFFTPSDSARHGTYGITPVIALAPFILLVVDHVARLFFRGSAFAKECYSKVSGVVFCAVLFEFVLYIFDVSSTYTWQGFYDFIWYAWLVYLPIVWLIAGVTAMRLEIQGQVHAQEMRRRWLVLFNEKLVEFGDDATKAKNATINELNYDLPPES